MIIAGCDPGAQGALSFIDAETRRVLAIIDMPMSGSELLVRELVADILETLDGRHVGHLVIERQAPFAKAGRAIGASSAFNSGQRYMAPKAIAACLGWPVEIISAVKWQAHFGITKANKTLAVAVADQMMPLDCGLWKVRRGYCNKVQASGRAEAALIGLYGVRMFAGLASEMGDVSRQLLAAIELSAAE